jgi:hypothetical protein
METGTVLLTGCVSQTSTMKTSPNYPQYHEDRKTVKFKTAGPHSQRRESEPRRLRGRRGSFISLYVDYDLFVFYACTFGTCHEHNSTTTAIFSVQMRSPASD